MKILSFAVSSRDCGRLYVLYILFYWISPSLILTLVVICCDTVPFETLKPEAL